MLYYDNWCSIIENDEQIQIIVNSTVDDLIRANGEFAHRIAKKATDRAAAYLGSRPVFCMSGGIDSQAAYQLWSKDVHIDVVIFKFANDLNSDEVKDAINYVTTHKIDHEIITLDVERFLNFKLIDFSKSNQLLSPQFAVHAYFLDHLKSLGYTGAVFGGNGFFIESNQVYFNLTSAQLLDLENYGNKNSFNVIPSFLSFDQDLCLKLALKTPLVLDSYINEPDSCFLPSTYRIALNPVSRYKNKIKSYQNLNLLISPQIEKKTGFEQIKNYYFNLYGDLWTFERKFRWPLRKNRKEKTVVTEISHKLKNKILYFCANISNTSNGKNLDRSGPGSVINRQFL